MSSSDCGGHGSAVVDAGEAGWLAAFGIKEARLRFPITGELAWSDKCVSSEIVIKNRNAIKTMI